MTTPSPTWSANFGQNDNAGWLDAYKQTTAPDMSSYFNQYRQANAPQQPSGFAQGVTATTNPKQQFYTNFLQRQATQSQQPQQNTEWQDWMRQYSEQQEQRIRELTEYLEQQRMASETPTGIVAPSQEVEEKKVKAPNYFKWLAAQGHNVPQIFSLDSDDRRQQDLGGVSSYKDTVNNKILQDMYRKQYGTDPNLKDISYITKQIGQQYTGYLPDSGGLFSALRQDPRTEDFWKQQLGIK